MLFCSYLTKITDMLPAGEGEYGFSIPFCTYETRLHTLYEWAKGKTSSACCSAVIG
jgi:hypothetical protein